MIIKELELDNFGKFNNYKLKFEAGVNLIYGENESGKSTLHSFIDGMFYGFLKPFTKKTIYLVEYENYKPLNSNLYRGNIEFELDGVTYRIERDFKKGRENTRIYEKSTGEDITYRASDLSAGKVIQPGIYFFGLSDLVFKNTVFISQQGIYTDDKLADEVRDRLVNVVTSRDENISVSKAMDILDLELKEIGTERAYTSKYGLLLKVLADNKIHLKEIQQKRVIYNEWIEKAEEINIQRENLRIKILEEEELLNQFSLNKGLIRYNEALELEKEIELLNKEISTLNEFKDISVEDYSKAEYLDYDINKLSSQIENIKSDIENIKYNKNSINVVNESEIKEIDTVIDDGFKIEYIQEKIGNDSLSSVEEKIKAYEKKNKGAKTGAGILSVIYLFLALYFVLTKNYLPLAATQFILLVIILLLSKLKAYRDSLKLLNNIKDLNQEILDIISKYRLHSIKEFLVKLDYAKNRRDEIDYQKTELIKLNDRIEIGKDNLRKLEKNLIDNKKDLDKILDINNQKSLEDFKRSKSQKLRYDEVQKELENYNRNLSKLLGGKTIEDYKVDKEQVEDFGIDLQNFDEEKKQNELKRLKNDLEKLSLNYKEYEVQIKNLEDQISKEASLNEEILSLESKKDYLDKKKSSIQYAANRIKELSTDIHRDYAPIINKKVGQLINKITAGKYKSVTIDKNLNVNLQPRDGGRLLNFNKLSAGTIDQIYFSLRMGLTEEIINKNLPLVLDECFVQYDDTRLHSILQVLIKNKGRRQIILFTCHNREKKILDNIEIEYNYIKL